MKIFTVGKPNKKADLNLSINAIVVLILAITMLGLGLGFMRNIFGGAVEEFKDVQGTVKKQMIDQMKESNKVVELNTPKTSLKIGDETQVFIGFKNDQAEDVDFSVEQILCDKLASSSGNNQCNNDPDVDGVWLEYRERATTVLPGEVSVLPINVKSKAGETIENTYFFELQISAQNEDGNKITKKVELTVDLKV